MGVIPTFTTNGLGNFATHCSLCIVNQSILYNKFNGMLLDNCTQEVQVIFLHSLHTYYMFNQVLVTLCRPTYYCINL